VETKKTLAPIVFYWAASEIAAQKIGGLDPFVFKFTFFEEQIIP
jgi:hypothetical protein